MLIPLKIRFFDNPPVQHSPSFIEWAVRLATPLMDAETANAEVIRLTLQNLRLQAANDAARMKEGSCGLT